MARISRRQFLTRSLATLGALAAGAYAGPAAQAAAGVPRHVAVYPPLLPDRPLPRGYLPVPARPYRLPQWQETPPPPPDRATLMAHWPEVAQSRVVVVRHAGALVDGRPDPEVVLQMLDAGVSALADGAAPLAVWQTLFDADEHVLLKVNCIAAGGPTQPAVTYAVAQRLQEAGLAAENLLIFDRTDHELADAGYALNDTGAGLQCRGTRGSGSEAVLTQATVRFYRELDEADALINLPTPKTHGIAGISAALKNQYGSVL